MRSSFSQWVLSMTSTGIQDLLIVNRALHPLNYPVSFHLSPYLTGFLFCCRQQSAETAVSDRVTQLVSLNRSLVPEASELLHDSVSRPYERATTPNGVPYYIK